MKPTLHLIVGLPGAGKTTLAKLLELELGAVRLTPDEWIARLLPPKWERAELDRFRDPTESIQWDVAARLLTLGVSVILDWGFWSQAERHEMRDRARSMGAACKVHYCEASLDELRNRLAARNRNLGPNEFRIEASDLARWAALFEPPATHELAER